MAAGRAARSGFPGGERVHFRTAGGAILPWTPSLRRASERGLTPASFFENNVLKGGGPASGVHFQLQHRRDEGRFP